MTNKRSQWSLDPTATRELAALEPEEKKWKLEGEDAFSNERYPIPGEWNTEEETRLAARNHLRAIEAYQPTEESGGQGDEGIQDRIFLIGPDGKKHRYLPLGAAS